MMQRCLATTAAAALLLGLSMSPAAAGKLKQIDAPAFVSASAAADSATLATMWVDGKRQELNGLDALEGAEKALRKAQKSSAKADAKLAKAQAVGIDQRTAYKNLVANFGDASDPKSIGSEIKSLRKAQDNWGDALKTAEKAEAAVIKARSEVAAAESAQRTASEQVSLGRQKMQQAEQQARPADAAIADAAEIDS
ncbi:MAG: hypothetical protein RIC52_13440, partial [Amphiplicatus sp.]